MELPRKPKRLLRQYQAVAIIIMAFSVYIGSKQTPVSFLTDDQWFLCSFVVLLACAGVWAYLQNQIQSWTRTTANSIVVNLVASCILGFLSLVFPEVELFFGLLIVSSLLFLISMGTLIFVGLYTGIGVYTAGLRKLYDWAMERLQLQSLWYFVLINLAYITFLVTTSALLAQYPLPPLSDAANLQIIVVGISLSISIACMHFALIACILGLWSANQHFFKKINGYIAGIIFLMSSYALKDLVINLLYTTPTESATFSPLFILIILLIEAILKGRNRMNGVHKNTLFQ